MTTMRIKDFLILLTRLFLGYVFLSAGFCKVTGGHFGQLIGPPWLEAKLAQYGLGFFAQVVAYLQIVCGALLLSQRYSTLGAVMLVPMNISILAVTVSQQWQGTPYVNAVFLILNIMLLLYEWKKFRFLYSDSEYEIKNTPLDSVRNNAYNLVALSLILLASIVAPYQNVGAAVLVSIAFIAVGLQFVVNHQFNLLEKVLIVQSVLNMLLITLAFRLGAVLYITAANTLVLTVTLALWGIIKARNKKLSDGGSIEPV